MREALEFFVDYRKLSKYGLEVKLASDVLYVWLTTLRGQPTMGEEYACITPCGSEYIRAIRHGMKVEKISSVFPGLWKRTLYLFYSVIIPYMFSKVAERVYAWIRLKFIEFQPGTTFWSRFKHFAG